MSTQPSAGDVLAVVKLLACGRQVHFVAHATRLTPDQVTQIAGEHGWPDRDRLRSAATELTKTATPGIPERAPTLTHPIPKRPAPPPPLPRPAPPAPPAPSAAAPTPEPPLRVVEDLIRACRRSEHKRTQALGPKLETLADKITTALRSERRAAEANAREAAEFTAHKATVLALGKQLADAKAALRALKPTAVTEGAPQHPCPECGALFTTSQGRALHTVRKHTPTPGGPTP